MNRRTFIRNGCLACAGSAWLSFVLQRCSSIRYVDGILSGNELRFPKSAFEEIRSDKPITHKFVVVRHAQLKYPIAVYHSAEYSFHALYMQCSHQGCEINAYETELVCPCHGSEFSLDGKVLQGPAETNLKSFDVSTEDDAITIYLK